jgi:hypothetical protein
MDNRTNSLGLPDTSGVYNYVSQNNNILLKPLTPVNTSKGPITNKKIVNKSSSIVPIIVGIIVVLIFSYAIYFLYNRIQYVQNYLNNSLQKDIQTVVNNTADTSFQSIYDSKINDKSNQLKTEILNNINTNIIPKIYSDASNVFLSSTTSAININTSDTAFPMLSKDTLICSDINNISTCNCLFDNCSQLSNFTNFLFVDRPIGFQRTEGYTYSGNVVPVSVDSNKIRITNQFCLTFYINITKTDPNNRIIFHWGGDNNYLLRYPSIIIRGNADTDYGGKYRNALEIRFSNLGPDGQFNVTSDVRDNCLDNLPLYVWNHITITANRKNLSFYLNGILVKSVLIQQDIKIGDPNQWIYIGKPFNDPNLSNPYGILLAKMRWFPNILPIEYLQFYANEYLYR